MSLRRKLHEKSGLWVATIATAAATPLALGTLGVTAQPAFGLAAGAPAANALPPALEREITTNDAAGLPGLDRGVIVPARCDIRTSLSRTDGRPRIEQERSTHRRLQRGATPQYIAVANAQLRHYLQTWVDAYCGKASTGSPADLEAEIAANDAAGLPGLDRGVTVPAGCDIRTNSDRNNGRPRIERERTAHRRLNQGNTPEYIAAANALLQSRLQITVNNYCANNS